MAVQDAIDRLWHEPIPLGMVLSAGGIAAFVLGVATLHVVFVADTGLACTAFKTAGWLVSAGWLQRRRETEQWPFSVPVVRDAVSTVLYRTAAMLGLVLSLLGLAALSLLAYVVLSCLTRS